MAQQPATRVTRIHYVFLDSKTLLVWARCPSVGKALQLQVNGRDGKVSKGMLMTEDGPVAYAVVTGKAIAAGERITFGFVVDGMLFARFDGVLESGYQQQMLVTLCERMHGASRQALLSMLLETVTDTRDSASAVEFRQMCMRLQQLVAGHAGCVPERAYWLTRNVLMLRGEAAALPVADDGEWQAVMMAPAMFAEVPVYAQVIDGQYSLICVFSDEALAHYRDGAVLFFDSEEAQRVVPYVPPAEAFGADYAGMMNQRDGLARLMEREYICHALLHCPTALLMPGVKELIQTLQLYVRVDELPCNDPQEPFTLQLEQAMPVGDQGIYLYGWMRDPGRLLERLEMISDLGFRMDILPELTRFLRPDVAEVYASSAYPSADAMCGIAAYLPLDAETQALAASVGGIGHVRFVAHLKGGVERIVVPPVSCPDAVSALDDMLLRLEMDGLNDEALRDVALTPAALLQAQAHRDAEIVQVLGKAPAKQAEVSLVIPCRGDMLALKTQLAALKRQETALAVTYVVDAALMEWQLAESIEELAAFYNVPARVVTVRHGVGSAAALNLAVKQLEDKAPCVLFLSPYALPKQNDSIRTMLTRMQKHKKLGVLGTVMLAEDGVIASAGMGADNGAMQPLMQGFAASAVDAKDDREVAALPLDCLLVDRAMFDGIGGFGSRWLSDALLSSDLCARMHADGHGVRLMGDALWYLPSVEVDASDVAEAIDALAFDALHGKRMQDAPKVKKAG